MLLIFLTVSELRVAVLGNNWKKSCSVGNLILGEEKFNTEEEPGRFLRARIERQDKALFQIIIPDFLQLTISDTEIQEQLSDLDPHVFLLVLHIDTFTEEHRLRLSRILQLFSDDSFEHSLILMSSQREVGLDENYRCHTHLYNMVKLCQYRYLREKNLEREELIVRLGQTAKKKSSDVIEEQDLGLLMKPSSKTWKKHWLKEWKLKWNKMDHLAWAEPGQRKKLKECQRELKKDANQYVISRSEPSLYCDF